MSLARLRSESLLFAIAAYMILDIGFMLLRVPPSGSVGVPIGEIIVMLFAATFVFDLHRVPSFAAVAPLVPILLWWSVGFTRAAIGLGEHGIWALRDASHLIDSTFIWIGFVVASVPGFMDRYARWLRLVVLIAAFYSFGYPFRETLGAFMPTVTAPAGYSVPIIFSYTSGTAVSITGAIGFLLDRTRLFGLPPVVLAGAVIVYAIVIFQMRSIYLQLAAIFLFLVVVRPAVFSRALVGMVLGAIALSVVLASGVEITGRLGEKFSFDFLLQHFAAIWGEKGEGALSGAAGGVGQRLDWWLKIWNNLTADAWSFLFGLGYGIPLTDFKGIGGVTVREPHNSMVSLGARLGLVGLVAFLWTHALLVRKWCELHAYFRRQGDIVWLNTITMMAIYILSVWVFSIGEDAFEKPFGAIPYYFFWGVMLRTLHLVRLAKTEEARGLPAPAGPAGLVPARA